MAASREVISKYNRKKNNQFRVVKPSQRGWGISTPSYFQNLTRQDHEQPHLAFKLALPGAQGWTR